MYTITLLECVVFYFSCISILTGDIWSKYRLCRPLFDVVLIFQMRVTYLIEIRLTTLYHLKIASGFSVTLNSNHGCCVGKCKVLISLLVNREFCLGHFRHGC